MRIKQDACRLAAPSWRCATAPHHFHARLARAALQWAACVLALLVQSHSGQTVQAALVLLVRCAVLLHLAVSRTYTCHQASARLYGMLAQID